MDKGIRIKRVSVEGLHDQFDIDLAFRPGLNIIYGKNGTGKTTILHLLANALECDFKRFAFLLFNRIHIENESGEIVEIAKENSAYPTIKINGSVTNFSEANPSLSEAELASLRSVLGGRPTYLPAFRSILERSRSDSPAHYYRAQQESQEPGYKEILQRELAALKESAQSKGGLSPWEERQHDEVAATTALKSVQCRQWFGAFVPVIRYPSVSEVEEALTEEWRSAYLEFTQRERRMLEEIFVKVFRAIAGLEGPPAIENNDDLLAKISDLLKTQEADLGPVSGDIYGALRTAVTSTAKTPASQRVDNSILALYREVLERRNNERQSAFQRTRDFEASVNKFLEGKTLTIGAQRGNATGRVRSSVSVVTEGGHSYPISALSSGERQILTMLYSASRTKFLSGVFLIDEPELSLHIDWQRIVLRELQNQSPDCQIIACTHSPEVGADHFDRIQDFEPRLTQARQASLFDKHTD